MEDRPQFVMFNNNVNITVIGSPTVIHTSEIKKIYLELKNGKVMGPGGIPLKLLKYGTDKLYEYLSKFFQECLNGAGVPSEWTISYISTIHKMGKKDEYENYCSSTISKIYGKILKNKIKENTKKWKLKSRQASQLEDR